MGYFQYIKHVFKKYMFFYVLFRTYELKATLDMLQSELWGYYINLTFTSSEFCLLSRRNSDEFWSNLQTVIILTFSHHKWLTRVGCHKKEDILFLYLPMMTSSIKKSWSFQKPDFLRESCKDEVNWNKSWNALWVASHSRVELDMDMKTALRGDGGTRWGKQTGGGPVRVPSWNSKQQFCTSDGVLSCCPSVGAGERTVQLGWASHALMGGGVVTLAPPVASSQTERMDGQINFWFGKWKKDEKCITKIHDSTTEVYFEKRLQ